MFVLLKGTLRPAGYLLAPIQASEVSHMFSTLQPAVWLPQVRC